jgi:hypothetical protein
VNRARAIWQFGEPVHAIIYYAPERQSATDALGLKGGWMSYFGCRAAPLGEASAPVVTALFYNFHPNMVARAIPDAWSYASAGSLLDGRLKAMDAAVRRVLSEEVVVSSALARASDLAWKAAADCNMAGHAMGAANQAIAEPTDSHVRLWQALTTMREQRGDGHVHALLDAGVSPAQALVLQAATGRSPEDGLRSHRGWSDEEWNTAAAQLVDRGLVDGAMRITSKGSALRQSIEDVTDQLAEPFAAGLSEAEADELIALLRPLAELVMATGAVPTHNNMGVPWPPPSQ